MNDKTAHEMGGEMSEIILFFCNNSRRKESEEVPKRVEFEPKGIQRMLGKDGRCTSKDGKRWLVAEGDETMSDFVDMYDTCRRDKWHR